MKSKKETTKTTTPGQASLFEKSNLVWMLAGIAVMALGFILMAGGASDVPNIFKPEEVYSRMRITVAPIVILAGLVVLIYAIFRNPKAE
jgi:hypothetical protein